MAHEDGQYVVDVIVFGGSGKTIELVQRGEGKTLGQALRVVLWRLSQAKVGATLS